MTNSRPPFQPVIRTQAELEETWRTLMGPFGFGGHSVWMLVIADDDRAVPQITEITHAVEPPEDQMIDGLAQVLRHLDVPGQRFAFLRSRPGPGGLTANDLAWANALYDAARRAGAACEVVHRACDADLVAVPMDALLGGDAA